MCVILSIETSTNVCSVAIHRKGTLLTYEECNVPNSHSEILNTYINKVLFQANLSVENLEAICISKGPGSYTGLRIGLSTAKGLCYGLGIPLISIDTLHGMYLSAKQQKRSVNYYIPMIDARRMEVYSSIFNQNGTCIKATQAQILDRKSFSETITRGKTLIFGNGARKFLDLNSKSSNLLFLDRLDATATSFGEYAYDKYKNTEFEDIAYFEPSYLKEFHTIPSKKISLVKNG